MLNSTFGNERWAFPRYFEYNIVRGPGNTRVEWIRVYIPGAWQPVAESALGPAPDVSSTCREWRRFYHFDVCWPRDSTGGTTLLVSYVSFYTWQYRNWQTRGYRPSVGSPDQMHAGLSSSSASSVSDGGWRSPSPPVGYDPNFDWDE